MKCGKILFMSMLPFVIFISIIIAQNRPYFCPPRCPLQGVFYCPSPCYASRQLVQGICCCNSTQPTDICCWYLGWGLSCIGGANWCNKYVQGYCDEYDKYEIGQCDRDSNYDLYCRQ